MAAMAARLHLFHPQSCPYAVLRLPKPRSLSPNQIATTNSTLPCLLHSARRKISTFSNPDQIHEVSSEATAGGSIVGDLLDYLKHTLDTKSWWKALELYEEIKALILLPTVTTMNALITILRLSDSVVVPSPMYFDDEGVAQFGTPLANRVNAHQIPLTDMKKNAEFANLSTGPDSLNMLGSNSSKQEHDNPSPGQQARPRNRDRKSSVHEQDI